MRGTTIALGVLMLSGCADASFEVAQSPFMITPDSDIETDNGDSAVVTVDTGSGDENVVNDSAVVTVDTTPAHDTAIDTTPAIDTAKPDTSKPDTAPPSVDAAGGMNCDPRSSSGCGGSACDVNGSLALFCRSAGSKAQGDACASGYDCAVGLTCAADKCRKFCRMGVSGDCGSETCGNPLFTHGGETYGTCN